MCDSDKITSGLEGIVMACLINCSMIGLPSQKYVCSQCTISASKPVKYLTHTSYGVHGLFPSATLRLSRLIPKAAKAGFINTPVTTGVEKLKCESWPAVTELNKWKAIKVKLNEPLPVQLTYLPVKLMTKFCFLVGADITASIFR